MTKLSEVKGQQAFDMIADLVEPVTEIAQSKQFAGMFDKRELPEGMQPGEFFIQRVRENLPSMVRDMKPQIAAILGTLNGVTPEKYMEQATPFGIVKDAFAVINDKALVDFLSSFSDQA